MKQVDIDDIETDEEFVNWMGDYGKFWRVSSYGHVTELKAAFNAGRNYQRCIGGDAIEELKVTARMVADEASE